MESHLNVFSFLAEAVLCAIAMTLCYPFQSRTARCDSRSRLWMSDLNQSACCATVLVAMYFASVVLVTSDLIVTVTEKTRWFSNRTRKPYVDRLVSVQSVNEVSACVFRPMAVLFVLECEKTARYRRRARSLPFI